MRLYGRPGRAYLFAALCVVDEDQVVAGGRVLVPGDDDSFTSEAWLAAYERDGTPAWSLTSPKGERADALVDLAAGGGDRFVALGLREVTGSPYEVSVVVTSYLIN